MSVFTLDDIYYKPKIDIFQPNLVFGSLSKFIKGFPFSLTIGFPNLICGLYFLYPFIHLVSHHIVAGGKKINFLHIPIFFNLNQKTLPEFCVCVCVRVRIQDSKVTWRGLCGWCWTVPEVDVLMSTEVSAFY